MEHRILTELYMGVARYRVHLERTCKDSTGAWRSDTVECFKSELTAWGTAFASLEADSMLYYQAVVEVAWQYARETGNDRFALDLVHHLYVVAQAGIRRIADMRREGHVYVENDKLRGQICQHLVVLRYEMQKGVRP